MADEAIDLPAFEAEKIKGAIRTDFVLSAEIIVIALGTVADKPLMVQFAVLAGIGLLMTVGVYGLVAGIVKLDDAGAWLLTKGRGAMRSLGGMLLVAAPKLMKLLTVVGTAAMFLVGGGFFGQRIGLGGFFSSPLGGQPGNKEVDKGRPYVIQAHQHFDSFCDYRRRQTHDNPCWRSMMKMEEIGTTTKNMAKTSQAGTFCWTDEGGLTLRWFCTAASHHRQSAMAGRHAGCGQNCRRQRIRGWRWRRVFASPAVQGG